MAECKINTFPKLVVYKKVKEVREWEECREKCNEEDDCVYFKWKVTAMNFSSFFYFSR